VHVVPELSRRSVLQAVGLAALGTVASNEAAFATVRPPLLTPSSGLIASPAVGIIRVAGKPQGTFAKVRCADDDTRLVLAYPSAAGTITAAITAAPAYYGLDFSAYPSGANAARDLQDLFDNTPFSYIGFYFPTTGHPGKSWQGKAQQLLDQGWALLPIYIGRQQFWAHSSDNQISSDVKTAGKQGTADGEHALQLASDEKLPAGSLIFLDIEGTVDAHGNNVPPAPQTIAYINAWLAKVGDRAALYDANSKWVAKGHTYYEAVVIHDQLNSDPCTWVAWKPLVPPVGVRTGRWPLDDNGDVCPVAIRRYSTNAQWDFAAFAQLWQFQLDWVPPDAAIIITDAGRAYPLRTIAGKIDLDAARAPDPAHTHGDTAKKRRRAAVKAVEAGSSTVKPGATTQLTITLDRKAPAPNGTLVLLRCDSADVILPSAARVKAGADAVIVTAAVAIGAQAGTARLTGRALYQLTGPPAEATLTIAAS
jgi:Domain of unknown function (DUF1906)